MINLDDNELFGDETEWIHPATCLERAWILLTQSGQVTCAIQVQKLQDAITEIAEEFHLNPNRPAEIVRWLIAAYYAEYHGWDVMDDVEVWHREACR